MKPMVDVAKELAAAHRERDPSTKEIYFLEHPSEIRLVEVSGSVGTTREVVPFHFLAQPEVPYASVVILLSDEEWAEVKTGDLALPEGWDREKMKPIR